MSVLALDVARDVAAPRRAEILETLRALADGADATTREIASDDDADALERASCDACRVDVPSDELLKFEKKWGPAAWLRDLDEASGARMAKDLEIQEEMRDALEDKDEKSSWEKMIKVREKMGKGPPVILNCDSEERGQEIVRQFSGNPHAYPGPPP